MNKLIVFLIIAQVVTTAVAIDSIHKSQQLANRLELVHKTAQVRADSVYDEMMYYTHPKTIQERTIDYLLGQGEFKH